MTPIDPADHVPNLYGEEELRAREAAELEPDPPEYLGRPRGVTPGSAPIALTLGESDQAAVLLTTVQAFPTGVTMIVTALLKDAAVATDIGDPIADHRLLLEVELPDGQRLGGTDPLTEYEIPGRPRDAEGNHLLPDHAVLRRAGGGGGEHALEQEFWLWPLPGPGTLRISCQWPERQIARQVHEIDMRVLIDAAQQAQSANWS